MDDSARAQQAEQIRLGIEGLSVVDGSQVSASLGVAALPGSAQSAKDLVASADRALYGAKQAGRNRGAKASAPRAAKVTGRITRRDKPQVRETAE